MLYIFILAFIISNFISFSQQPLISLTLQDKVNNKVHYYDTFELRGVRSLMNKNPGTFILPPSTVSRVISLKIQRKMRKKHCGGVGRVQLLGNCVYTNNLRAVTTISFHDKAQEFENRNSKWIKCTLANLRSLKSKELEVFNYVLVEKIDLMLLVETWLRENDGDDIWKKHQFYQMGILTGIVW